MLLPVPDLIIRKSVESDISDLIELVDERQTGATSEDKALVRQYIPEIVLDQSSTVYFVAEINHKLIGYVTGNPLNEEETENTQFSNIDNVDDIFYCGDMFITKSLQGKGLSKPILKTFMDYASGQGYKEILMTVSIENIPSLKLHRSF